MNPSSSASARSKSNIRVLPSGKRPHGNILSKTATSELQQRCSRMSIPASCHVEPGTAPSRRQVLPKSASTRPKAATSSAAAGPEGRHSLLRIAGGGKASPVHWMWAGVASRTACRWPNCCCPDAWRRGDMLRVLDRLASWLVARPAERNIGRRARQSHIPRSTPPNLPTGFEGVELAISCPICPAAALPTEKHHELPEQISIPEPSRRPACSS
jgi:hypothetical protein